MAQYNFKHLNHTDIPEEVEIAVVGAGVSGLYSTWKILEQNPRTNICILDQIGRIGGRLDSDVIKFKNEATGEVRSVKEEEGGMRFTFDSMDNLMALLMKLNLTDDIVPFPMSSDGNNRLYFRGKPFTNNDSGKDDYAVWSDLYNLEVSEQGTNPKTIINTVYNRILDVNPAFTDSDVFKLSEKTKERGPVFWQAFRLNCAWKGVGLKDWQLQGLLADMGYSTEVINLLYRLSGFNGTFLSEMSAGIAYQLLEEFPKDPKFKTLKLGFSMLTNGMVDAIRSIQPNKRTTVQRIFLRTTVDGIDHSEKDDSFVVNYTQIRGTGVSQTIKTGTIKAKKIILGLPRLALEKLFIGSGVFGKLGTQASARLWNQLQSTSNQPLVKINLYYDRAWWGNGISGQPAVAFGPNFSDTPMGSVYPFYTVDEKIAAALEYARWLRSQKMDIPADIQAILDSKYQMPAALTIYCDYMNVNFWKALQNVGQPYMTEMQRAHKKLLPASEAVVDKATDFFKKLFNTHYVPKPTLTSARIWSGSSYFPTINDNSEQQHKNTEFHPYGYGVHFWALGAQDNQVIQSMIQPIEGVEIYTCGESFSDYQGWVEGALRSANLVLEKAFGIPSARQAFIDEHGAAPNPTIKKHYWNRYKKEVVDTLPEVDKNFAHATNPYLSTEEQNHGATTTVLETGSASAPGAAEVNYGVDLKYFNR